MNYNDNDNNNIAIQIYLTKFETCIKTFLVDIVRKTCQKWAVNDYTNNSNIEVIILLITKLRAIYTNFIKKTFSICQCFIRMT